MSVQVMVALPDQVYRRAESLARLTSRDVSKLLADTIEISLPALGSAPDDASSIAQLPDDAVLRWAESQLGPSEDQRLSLLLSKQQDADLSEWERGELAALMQAYQEGLLRKAQALAEAVRRGLMASMGGRWLASSTQLATDLHDH